MLSLGYSRTSHSPWTWTLLLFSRLEDALAGFRGWCGCRQHWGNTFQQARCKSIKLRWILSLSSGVAVSTSRRAYLLQYGHPAWELMTFFTSRSLGGLGLARGQCFKPSTCFIMLTRKHFSVLPEYRWALRSATLQRNEFPRNTVWGWELMKLFEMQAVISCTEKTPLF